MIKLGYEQVKVTSPVPRTAFKLQSFLFISPMLITTGVSILIFSMVKGLSVHEQNIYSLIIIGAVIISLLGMAPIQMVMYRLIDEPAFYDGGIIRGLKVGIIGGLVYSTVILVLALVGFLLTDFLSFSDVLFFALLVLIYSLTWVMTSAFFAAEAYFYQSLVFAFVYLILYLLIYLTSQFFNRYFGIAFITGSTLLPLISGILALIVFKKPESKSPFKEDLRNILKLALCNIMPVIFNMFYVIAIFLDKLIIWTLAGIRSGGAPVIAISYTIGGFLGLIPMLGACGVAYFTARTRNLVRSRYEGTLTEIQRKCTEYMEIYKRSLLITILIAVGLTVITGITGYFYFPRDVFLIMITIASGSIYLVGILLNASVLPIFGKNSIASLSMGIVIVFELASIPFAMETSWYAAAGFLFGNVVGFILSLCYTAKLLKEFERNLFRFLVIQTNK